MATGIEFVLSLNDKLSGPANNAKKSMAGLGETMRKMNAVGDKLGAMSKAWGASDANKSLRTGADEMGRIGRAAFGLSDALSRIRPVAGAVGGALGAVAKADAALGVGAVSAAGGLALAGAKYAADMASFKEKATFGFKAVLGGQAAADGMMTESMALAKTLGMNAKDVTNNLQTLVVGGFSTEDSEAIFAALADLKTIKPQANLENLMTALTQIKGGSSLALEELNQLKEGGLSLDKVYARLGQAKGLKGPDAVKKAISAGQITPEEGIAAITGAISDMGGGGPLGALRKKFSQDTTAGKVEALDGAFSRLFMRINTNPVGDAIGRMASALTKFLDPDAASGQKILAVFNKVAALAGRLFNNIDPAQVTASIGKAFDYIERMIPVTESVLRGFGKGFMTAFAPMFGALSGIFGKMGSSANDAEKWEAVGSKIGSAVGIAVDALLLLPLAIGKITSLFDTASASAIRTGEALAFPFVTLPMLVAGLAADMLLVAVDLVRGFNAGVVAAFGSVRDTFKSLGRTAIEALKNALQIHSPSRLFAQLGMRTVEGFVVGVDEREPEVRAATAGLIELPAPSLLGSASAAGRSAGGVSVGDLVFNIHASSEGSASAQDIARAVRDEVQSLFDRLAYEQERLAT